MASWVVERRQLREVTHRFAVEAETREAALACAAADYDAGEGREVEDAPAAGAEWGATCDE